MDAATGQRRQRVRIELQRHRTGDEDDVHFYGLGQGGGATLDRLGTSRLLWNNQVGHGPGVDFAVPLLVAIAPGGAYGLFFDTTAQARLDTARGSGGQTLRYEADAPALDVYFLAVLRPADVLEAYAGLTGAGHAASLVAGLPPVDALLRGRRGHPDDRPGRCAKSSCPAMR